MAWLDMENGFFTVLATDPPVFYLKDWVLRRPRYPNWRAVLAVRGRPAHLLVQLSWNHEPDVRADGLAAVAASRQRVLPRQHMTFLVNTRAEQEALRKRGLDTLLCNGSVFLSGDTVYPIAGCRKEFRAVYDAVVSPYKRHALAGEVRDLALIAYTKHDSTPEYVRGVMRDLPRAHWLNGRPDTGCEWLDDAQVNAAINRARVGLCLSPEEGFMYASAQYLLAGLPVVSTASEGGRDLFYGPAYTRVVADDQAAVATAVDDFCADPPEPSMIRRRTLEGFEPHRQRFLALMRDICAGHGSAGTWENGLPAGLPNKLIGNAFSLRQNLAALREPGSPAPWQRSG